MAANNEFNLVISDEEGGNPYSGRTQNTLSQHGSPGAQFIRQAKADPYSDQHPYKNIISPLSHETNPSYEKEYVMYSSEGHVPFHTEDAGTGQTNSEYYSTIQPVQHTVNSTKAQFIKKAIKPTHDSQNSEDEFDRQAMYGGTFAPQNVPAHLHPREYLTPEDIYAQYPDQMMQGTHDRYGEDYGEMDSQDVHQGMYQDEEQKSQLRDSQLSGPLRYSKMSEEEAALAFENRKKELFSTYLKKGPRKSPGPKGIATGNEGNQRNMREIPSPDDPYGKNGVSGFVIYNNKSPGSSQPPSAQLKGQNEDKNNRGLHMKRKSSIERKENPVNTVTLSKQRKDSPSGRTGPRPMSQKQTPKSQKATLQKANANDRITPRDERSNKVQVDYGRNSASKKKGQGNSYEENRTTNESRLSHNRPQNASYKQEQQAFANAHLDDKYAKKNREILHDIHNIDEEIYRLESESHRKSHQGPGPGPRQEGFTQYEYMQKFETNQNKNGPDQRKQGGSKWNGNERRSRSRSLQKENSFDKKDSKYQQQGHNVKEEREKRQRINELNQDKGMRYTDTSQAGSIKEQLHQSYMVLNERGYEQHSDYLYDRAVIQMKSRETLHERNKEMREQEELMQCTFSPQIKTVGDPRIEDIVTRTRNWQLEKERQLQLNERSKVEKELQGCTFYPNGALEKDTRLEFNANNFYKRNIEWMKRKEAEDKRKQNEQYKSIMSVPEKNRSQANLSFSRVNESHDGKASTLESNRGGRMQRTSSNKSLKTGERPGSAQKTDSARNVERPGSAQKKNSARSERPGSVEKRDSARNMNRPGSAQRRDSTEKKLQSSYKKSNQMTPSRKNSAKLVKTEKTLETQEDTEQKKEAVDPQLQSQILESYAILDNLQHFFTSKEKEKEANTLKEKQGVGNKLKTLTVPPKATPQKPEPKIQTAKARYVPSPTRSQTRLSAKLPVTSPGYVPDDSEPKMQNITVKNNRYFIEEKPFERRNSKPYPRERSNSKDSKRRPLTPSKDYGANKYQKDGSYMAASQAKKKGESPFKSKQIPQKNYDTSISKSNYSDVMASPFHSLMTSPQNAGLYGISPSPRTQLEFVSKGMVSPNSQNLEKKYLTLLNQVSRVTKQLDNLNVENNTLQQDIESLQKRQMNKSGLYS